MAKLVEIKNLSKSYGDRIIFNDINITIDEGEFLSIVGPSGCGKSTLLNMIGLLEEYDSGDIKISGKKIPPINSSKAVKVRRDKINYLFQSYALINDMTVIQNLLIAMKFLELSKKEKLKRIKEVLEYVKLYELRNQKVNTLSGGEQQRVAIARTILKPGDIILADEPTGALDSETADIVFSLIRELSTKYGKTIIMVTHSEELAGKTDRIIDLKQYM